MNTLVEIGRGEVNAKDCLIDQADSQFTIQQLNKLR